MKLRSFEEKLNRIPFKIVVGKVNFGTGEMEEWLNEQYKDKLEVLILTTTTDKKIKFYRSHIMGKVENKEKIAELFKGSFYEKEVNLKGIYYTDSTIYLKETYTDSILETLEKVFPI